MDPTLALAHYLGPQTVGASWSRFTLPVADNIYFSDPQIGWAIGGPTDDQIFKTQRCRGNLERLRPADIPVDTPSTTHLPFYSGGHGLFVMTNEGVENSLEVYSLQNPADQWLLADQVKLDVQPGMIGLSILDAQNFVAVIPGTKSIVRMTEWQTRLILKIRMAFPLPLLSWIWFHWISGGQNRLNQVVSPPLSRELRLLPFPVHPLPVYCRQPMVELTWQSVHLPLFNLT